MVYRNISSSIIIATIYSDFAIDYSDWEVRALEWIGRGLGLVGCYSAMVDATPITRTIQDYKIELPCDIRVLDYIEYSGMKVPRIESKLTLNPDIIDSLDDSVSGYFISNNFLYFTFTDEEVTIYYKTLPVDKKGFPMIPDNDALTEYLKWYVLAQILSRGHKHPVFSYEDAEIRFKDARKKAKNSMSAMDKDQRKLISDIWNSTFFNRRIPETVFFNDSSAPYRQSDSAISYPYWVQDN